MCLRWLQDRSDTVQKWDLFLACQERDIPIWDGTTKEVIG